MSQSLLLTHRVAIILGLTQSCYLSSFGCCVNRGGFSGAAWTVCVFWIMCEAQWGLLRVSAKMCIVTWHKGGGWCTHPASDWYPGEGHIHIQWKKDWRLFLLLTLHPWIQYVHYFFLMVTGMKRLAVGGCNVTLVSSWGFPLLSHPGQSVKRRVTVGEGNLWNAAAAAGKKHIFVCTWHVFETAMWLSTAWGHHHSISVFPPQRNAAF